MPDISIGVVLSVFKAVYQILNPKKNALISVKDQDLLADMDRLIAAFNAPFENRRQQIFSRGMLWGRIAGKFGQIKGLR